MAEHTHWTERSTADFLFKIGADFVRQIEKVIGAKTQSRSQIAETLGVSKGRVSQVLNNPGNLTLKKMIEYGRAMGKKISVVAYDDRDPGSAPVSGELFIACWERAGKPRDFFDLSECDKAMTTFMISIDQPRLPVSVRPDETRGNTLIRSMDYQAVADTATSRSYRDI